MKRSLFIPLRFKILFSTLLGLSIVVGAITFTMANIFHADKTAYIRDLISTNTTHASQEAHSLLLNYLERIKTITRVAYDAGIPLDEKSEMLDDLFAGFPEMIAITFHEGGIEQTSVFDELALTSAGLSKTDLDAYRAQNPVALEDLDPDGVLIRNSTFNQALPMMTMVTGMVVPGLGSEIYLEAVIRTDRFISIVSRSELFEVFVLEPEGGLLIHKDPERILNRSSVNWTPDAQILSQGTGLAAIFEFDLDGSEMLGGFMRIETGDLIVGALIPKATAFLSARELLSNLLVTSLVILLFATIVSLVWSHRITRPLAHLTGAASDIGRGDFEVSLKPTSRDEIGVLTESIDRMAHELGHRERSLKETQAALIQSEKMSAFGQLSAGIAHEVKNPLAGILGYTQLTLKQAKGEEGVYKNLKIIEQETRRCNSIIENLMKFARQDKPELKPLAINDVIEDSLVLVDHQMGISQVTLEKDLAEGLPEIRGDTNQLIQVLMNLMINAQQAMDGKPGTIAIKSGLPNAGVVEVRISDTGPGMSEEVSSKIFEPFFTTKESGKGTGLGLSVTYGIIKDHGGNIKVESEPGEGSTFIITFPFTTKTVTSEGSSPGSPDPPATPPDASSSLSDGAQQTEEG